MPVRTHGSPKMPCTSATGTKPGKRYESCNCRLGFDMSAFEISFRSLENSKLACKQRPKRGSSLNFYLLDLEKTQVFLELDRSTESLDRPVERALRYLSYDRSGDFSVQNGGGRNDYKLHPFRVLMIFKTDERRNNMAEALIRSVPPVLWKACLTTFAEATSDPYGPIWIYPSHYRDAISGTPFGTLDRARSAVYKPQHLRDAFIEAHIKTISILLE